MMEEMNTAALILQAGFFGDVVQALMGKFLVSLSTSHDKPVARIL